MWNALICFNNLLTFLQSVCVCVFSRMHYTVLALDLLVFLLQGLSRSNRVSDLLLGLQQLWTWPLQPGDHLSDRERETAQTLWSPLEGKVGGGAARCESPGHFSINNVNLSWKLWQSWQERGLPTYTKFTKTKEKYIYLKGMPTVTNAMIIINKCFFGG